MGLPTRVLLVVLAILFQFGGTSPARADEVLDWNAVLRRAIVAGNPGLAGPRAMAIVHTAMFDAHNGIERRFTPLYVDAAAPRGASRRAAVVQAAYTTLLALFPAQAADLATDLHHSLLEIAASGALNESNRSVQRGRVWGEYVAREILAWRSTDGLNPPGAPYLGSLTTGKWRPTPTAFLPGGLPTLARMVPFVIPTASTFRPAGPPSLTSQEYAADVNEVKLVGELTSAARTADQTESARFWAGAPHVIWNRVAEAAARHGHTTLSDNARLFALLNVAMSDAGTTCWDSKYYFELWRPITAIRLASTDGNPATIEQADWTPLIPTPPYPEYFSGNQSLAGAAQAILTDYFGDRVPVEGTSENLPGVVRWWRNFAAVADDAFMARIWSGIHFRFAMRDTRTVAEKVAEYVLEHAAQPRE